MLFTLRAFPVLNLPKAWTTEEGVGKQWFLTPLSVHKELFSM